MVPWETLRRLLGLPADMEPPDSVALVRMALDQPRHTRVIAMALRGRTPKEAPAAIALAAYERGRIDAPRVAELLGAVGHAAGYAAVRSVLLTSADRDACEQAGRAMARILGQRADEDLVLALRLAPSREGREGAAAGLCELGSAEAAASVAEAGLDGRIRVRVAARTIVRLPFDAEHWLELLEASELRARRLATEVVYELVNSVAFDGPGTAELSELGERGKAAVRRALSDRELYMLPDKREQLTQWAEKS
jgi:hypothetical protein